MNKIKVMKNKRGKWFWHLVSKNGRILANSEEYSSKQACLRTANKILK